MAVFYGGLSLSHDGTQTKNTIKSRAMSLFYDIFDFLKISSKKHYFN